MHEIRPRFAPIVACAVLAPSLLAQGPYATRTILLEGDPLQGGDSGVVEEFGLYNLTRSGEILLYTAQRNDPGTGTSEVVLWRYGVDGAFQAVVRESDIAPGTQAPFGRFGSGVMANDGSVLFNTSDGSFFIPRNGVPETLALTGGGVPEVPGETFSRFDSALNAGADAAFFLGRLVSSSPNVDSTNARGIWRRNAGGTPTLFARAGDLAPGAGGTRFGGGFDVDGLPFFLAVNNVGRGAFVAELRNGINDPTSDQGLWSVDADGSLQLITRRGDEAPGAPRQQIVRFDQPVTNTRGDALLGVTYTSSNALVVLSDGALTTHVRSGDVLPGTDGLPLTSVNSFASAFNDAGQIAFTGRIANGDQVVYITDDTAATLVARSGTPAPGAGGDTYEFISDSFALNNRGDYAFLAALAGADVSSNNALGLFAYDSAMGETVLLLRTGDLFDVDDAPDSEDLRVIDTLEIDIFRKGNSGDGASISDDDYLVTRIGFTDGTSGLFRVQIPTPGALALFAATGLGVGRRRRRRHA